MFCLAEKVSFGLVCVLVLKWIRRWYPTARKGGRYFLGGFDLKKCKIVHFHAKVTAKSAKIPCIPAEPVQR